MDLCSASQVVELALPGEPVIMIIDPGHRALDEIGSAKCADCLPAEMRYERAIGIVTEILEAQSIHRIALVLE
jgi:hypothetical protein